MLLFYPLSLLTPKKVNDGKGVGKLKGWFLPCKASITPSFARG